MASSRFASRFDGQNPLVTVTPSIQPAPKSQIWDMLRVFAAFLAIVLARGQTDRGRFWGILGLGTLMLAIGMYRPLHTALQRFALQRHDKGVARKYGQEFRRITLDAGQFVNPNPAYSDTLAAVLNQVNQRLCSQPQNALFIALSRIPQTQIFMDRWDCFNTRIQKDTLSAEQFHAAVDELTSILRSYTNYCAIPIFHTFANEYRELLMDNEKSQFNAFQQSYCAYLGRFANFVNRLNDDFHGFPQLSAAMPLPKPL